MPLTNDDILSKAEKEKVIEIYKKWMKESGMAVGELISAEFKDEQKKEAAAITIGTLATSWFLKSLADSGGNALSKAIEGAKLNDIDFAPSGSLRCS